jgi:hypothetical protein
LIAEQRRKAPTKQVDAMHVGYVRIMGHGYVLVYVYVHEHVIYRLNKELRSLSARYFPFKSLTRPN